jgi:Undecaprenyl-phosphate galactose phosphotransferase WbaP
MSSIALPADSKPFHDLMPQKAIFTFFIFRHARTWMSMTLAMSDMLSLLLAALSACWFYQTIHGGTLEWTLYQNCIPLVLVVSIYFAFRGLYPAIGIGPVEELRLLTINTSMVFIVIAASTFWLHSEYIYSRVIFLLSWGLSLASLPFGRIIVRALLGRLGLWGEPVAIIGPFNEACAVAEELHSYPGMGRFPAVIFDPVGLDLSTGGLKVLLQSEIGKFIRSHGIRSALIYYEDLNTLPLVRSTYHDIFERVLLVSGPKHAFRLSGVSVQDFGGQLSLEIRHSLQDRWAQFQKRQIDVLAAGLMLLLFAPFFLLIAILIHLDSPGSALFIQRRLGKGGKPFRMLKFRTMYSNAEEVLSSVLAYDPTLKVEWDCYQKLKKDPRITPIGRVLRRFSIDELPQIWNVFIGEMSLVGPRPILPEQLEMYGNQFDHYARVTPGMTGLWQVLGRNKTSFSRRAELDVHYVMNWSIWLDVYILARTVWVVAFHCGAC